MWTVLWLWFLHRRQRRVSRFVSTQEAQLPLLTVKFLVQNNVSSTPWKLQVVFPYEFEYNLTNCNSDNFFTRKVCRITVWWNREFHVNFLEICQMIIWWQTNLFFVLTTFKSAEFDRLNSNADGIRGISDTRVSNSFARFKNQLELIKYDY